LSPPPRSARISRPVRPTLSAAWAGPESRVGVCRAGPGPGARGTRRRRGCT
jgi:hypothetical protein